MDIDADTRVCHSEAHLLEAVRVNEGANATELAKILGITNGAVWQSAKKLAQKHLLEKYKHPDNRKEVYFCLTALGEKACAVHNHLHVETSAQLHEYVMQLDKNSSDAIDAFLEVVMQQIHKEMK